MGVALVAVLLGLSGSLYGCGGCDTDDGEACAQTYASSTAATTCDSITHYNTLSTCIKDADCCDHEEDGSNMKQVLVDAKAALDAVMALVGASCATVSTTNACA